MRLGEVLALRERTGCSMVDALKALVHAEGDHEIALEYIARVGLAVAFRGTPAEQKALRYPKWAARCKLDT